MNPFQAQEIVDNRTTKYRYGAIARNKKTKAIGIIINYHQQNGVLRFSLYQLKHYQLDENSKIEPYLKQTAWSENGTEILNVNDNYILNNSGSMDVSRVIKLLVSYEKKSNNFIEVHKTSHKDGVSNESIEVHKTPQKETTATEEKKLSSKKSRELTKIVDEASTSKLFIFLNLLTSKRSHTVSLTNNKEIDFLIANFEDIFLGKIVRNKITNEKGLVESIFYKDDKIVAQVALFYTVRTPKGNIQTKTWHISRCILMSEEPAIEILQAFRPSVNWKLY